MLKNGSDSDLGKAFAWPSLRVTIFCCLTMRFLEVLPVIMSTLVLSLLYCLDLEFYFEIGAPVLTSMDLRGRCGTRWLWLWEPLNFLYTEFRPEVAVVVYCWLVGLALPPYALPRRLLEAEFLLKSISSSKQKGLAGYIISPFCFLRLIRYLTELVTLF